MASASPPWIILYKTPHVSAAAADAPRPGGAISLALAAPPRVSRLVVDPSVFPADPDSQAKVPNLYIKATGPSGHFLAEAKPSKSDSDGISKPFYLLLDVPSGTASLIPNPDVFRASSLAVIAASGGGYMIVAFRAQDRDNQNLVCFSSETREWVNKTVVTPQLSPKWTITDVITHDGKIWWVDRAHGILACDPFADQPDMAYIPLPRGYAHDQPGHENCNYCTGTMLSSLYCRCVNLSNGKFRCVEVGPVFVGKAPKITMHTLADPATAEWTLDYQVSFDEIWADDSYKATGLPEEPPTMISLIHPKNPDIIYFSVEKNIFGVDMPKRKVVECEISRVRFAKDLRVMGS
ncbi:hypothetical protein PR202_ga26574 [Eleusine coracana subsp. coracana]|uniref:DUF1618 domain-containing protein n=1 Tax=Eleusine coracana subsp. coracana TaxID=191504 RepID=A0AAV5DEE9_ELECO|nr:hypothetical protein PR202_ga26574 [Eleusine coracana subsp. coracana]